MGRTPHGYRVERRLRKHKRELGEQWKISDEEARKLLVSPCYFCGSLAPLPWSNGIERLDNSLDVSPGNAVPVCEWCNAMKWTRHEREFIARCKAIVELRGYRLLTDD